MRTFILSFVIFAGCATSNRQSAQELPGEGNRFATRAECEQLVEHMVKLVSLDTTRPRQDLFRAREHDPATRQAMVDRCTTSVNKAGHDCLLAAHDLQQAKDCEKQPHVTASRFYDGLQ